MILRVNFEKRGPVRFASHRDVVRIIQRGIAAAGIPVSFSQGFHPHMRMSFGPPLKTGWEGFDEYLDIHFEETVESLAERCNAFMPEGLRFMASAELVAGVPKLANDISAASYEVRVRVDELGDAANQGADEWARNTEEIVSRLGTEGAAGESSPGIVAVSLETRGEDLRIDYTSTMRSGRVVPPQDVVATFDDSADLPTPPRVARSAQYVARNGELLSPMSETVIQGTI